MSLRVLWLQKLIEEYERRPRTAVFNPDGPIVWHQTVQVVGETKKATGSLPDIWTNPHTRYFYTCLQCFSLVEEGHTCP